MSGRTLTGSLSVQRNPSQSIERSCSRKRTMNRSGSRLTRVSPEVSKDHSDTCGSKPGND